MPLLTKLKGTASSCSGWQLRSACNNAQATVSSSINCTVHQSCMVDVFSSKNGSTVAPSPMLNQRTIDTMHLAELTSCGKQNVKITAKRSLSKRQSRQLASYFKWSYNAKNRASVLEQSWELHASGLTVRKRTSAKSFALTHHSNKYAKHATELHKASSVTEQFCLSEQEHRNTSFYRAFHSHHSHTTVRAYF